MPNNVKGKRVYPDGADNFYIKEPGDFGLWHGIWYAKSPNGFVANLGNHKVVENEDGTITVSPSIGIYGNTLGQFAYHGYLENGVWRDA